MSAGVIHIAPSSNVSGLPRCFWIFILMTRRPPRSTLFPYTTLPISRRWLHGRGRHLCGGGTRDGSRRAGAGASSARVRSEEHTSELQSRFDLVCRLLLEKKNACPQVSYLSLLQGLPLVCLDVSVSGG